MLKGFINGMGRPVTLISLLYILVGSLWILFSDKLVLIFFHDAATITQVQTYKGWFFVFGSGVLIYGLLSLLLADLRRKEKDLRDTELQHRDFLNKHYQPIWKSDTMGNCIFYNDKWVEFAGKPIEANRPFAWLDFVETHDKPYCIDKFTYGYINKKNFELEYRILVKEDEYHWVLNHCIAYFDSSGRFQGFMGFYTDIQEKKLLQEKYKDSSKRYGYLFANNPNPMLVYDLKDLRILEANKAAFMLYGYTDREFLSLSIIDLRPSSEIPQLMDHVSNSLPDYHRSSGWIHKRKDGSLFDAEVTAHSLPETNDRKMRLVIIRDITEQIKAFRSAKEGDRRFKAIFDHSPQGSIICTDDLRIADINPAACTLLAIEKPRAIDLSLFDFLNADKDPVAFDYTEKLITGRPLIGEVNMIRSGGIEFRVSFNAIQFSENGSPRIYFSFSDIHEKHKMQIALQESERINATLVTNLPGMVYRCRFDEAWTMIYVSHGVEKLTGYKPDEIINNSIISYEELIHPEDRNEAKESIVKAIEKRRKFDIQYRIIAKNNKIKWVWEQARGIYNTSNELIYIEGFIMDITLEKEAQHELEFQSNFMSLIVDNIPFPLFYKDANGVFIGCNKPYCDILGRDKHEIIGRTVFDMFSDEQARVFDEKDKDLIKKGGSQIYETEISFSDGRKMNAVFHKSVFKTLNNGSLGIIGIYFDITQRVQAETVIKKQLEELGRINSELERFSYTVSHDLRSPLVTIKGFLGLLKEDLEEQNEEQVKEDMMRIENATDKMQQLLEDLLKLSRLDKTFEQNEEFSMSLAAREAHELLFGLLQGKKCEVFIKHDMPVVVGGKARIRELFQNLMENAVKFTTHHQNPVIKVYSRKLDGVDIYCVEDNGIGIHEKYHEKIFGLFNKLDNNSPGSGLGLSLVKRIVENHNGRVWVESDGNNNGAIFCFTLNTEKSKDV